MELREAPLVHAIPSFPRFAGRGIALAALTAGALIAAHVSTVRLLVERWNGPDGAYEHGPLVPLVSLGLAWRVRHRLVPRADARGLGAIVLALGVLLGVAGAPFRMAFLSGTSMVLELVGLALLLGGRALTRALAFPLGFLAFAIPLPYELVSKASFELKLVAARLAIAALSLAGITAIGDGSTVHLANGSVVVEDVCSGLRSLIALLALGVLVAGLEPRFGPWRRVALAALAAPIALAANAVRVAFLCGAVALSGPWVLDSWIHEGSGLVLFGSALALLLGARAWLAPRDERETPAGPFPSPVLPSARSLALALALLVPAAIAPWALGRPPRSDAPPIFVGLPLAAGEWRAEEMPVDDSTRATLDTRDIVMRRYERDGAPAVYFTGAASRGDRKAVHPPEVCTTGGGFAQEDLGEVELLPGLAARWMELARGDDRQLYVWFYATGDALGPSYVKLQLVAVVERVRDPDVASALVRFSVPLARGVGREAALDSVRALARALVPAVRSRLQEVAR